MYSFTIIPGLVTLETNVPSLKDFLLAPNLSFYPWTRKEQNHYSVQFTNSVTHPQKHSHRIGNYTHAGNTMYYRRNLFKHVAFSFSYDPTVKTFYYNPLYKYHFVNIGDILTVGRNLFHIIESDLAKKGYYIVLGAAVKKKTNTVVFLAPNGNGKTNFVNKAIQQGYTYIAENFIIIHPDTSQLFGIAPVFSNKNRASNLELAKNFKEHHVSVASKAEIKQIYLLSQHSQKMKNSIIDNYTDTYTQYYKKNNLVRSLTYLQLENTLLDTQYKKLRTFLYNRTKIISEHSQISL